MTSRVRRGDFRRRESSCEAEVGVEGEEDDVRGAGDCERGEGD